MNKTEYLSRKKELMAELDAEYMEGNPRKFNKGDTIAASYALDLIILVDRINIFVGPKGDYDIVYGGFQLTKKGALRADKQRRTISDALAVAALKSVARKT